MEITECKSTIAGRVDCHCRNLHRRRKIGDENSLCPIEYNKCSAGIMCPDEHFTHIEKIELPSRNYRLTFPVTREKAKDFFVDHEDKFARVLERIVQLCKKKKNCPFLTLVGDTFRYCKDHKPFRDKIDKRIGTKRQRDTTTGSSCSEDDPQSCANRITSFWMLAYSLWTTPGLFLFYKSIFKAEKWEHCYFGLYRKNGTISVVEFQENPWITFGRLSNSNKLEAELSTFVSFVVRNLVRKFGQRSAYKVISGACVPLC